MLNTLKVQSMWRERLWRRPPKTYAEVCDREWTLQPSEIQQCPPSIYFNDHLDRITAVQHETTREIEDRRLRGGPVEQGATVAYLLRNVELIDGWIYSKTLRAKVAHSEQHLFVPRAQETFDQASLACSLPGNTYFGHWLTDDLLLHKAVDTMAPPVIVDRGNDYSHESGYCELLNIKQRKVARTRFKELIVLDDRGQNEFKRQRYQDLRKSLREAVPESGARNVFIRRGTQNANAERRLMNSTEIETFLMTHGFEIIDPDTQSAAEMAKKMMNAQVVVGVEGSHLNHGLMPLADGGTICCLQPPYRFNNIFKDIADSLHASYALVVGVAVEGGFSVPLDDMKRMLDRLQAA